MHLGLRKGFFNDEELLKSSPRWTCLGINQSIPEAAKARDLLRQLLLITRKRLKLPSYVSER